VSLEPNQTRIIVFTLGAAEDGKEDVAELVRRYTGVDQSEQALQEVHDFWSRFIDAERVATPDPAFDL